VLRVSLWRAWLESAIKQGLKYLMHTITLTRPIFPDQIASLQTQCTLTLGDKPAAYTQDELIGLLQHARGAITTLREPITAAVLDACPKLKVVSNIAVGYNNIDVAACTARGVVVTNTPDVLTQTTADFAWALLMAAARRLPEAERYLRAGQWQHWSLNQLAGKDMHGATLGIVGMGRIGAAIAARAAGFGMKVLYHNRSPLPLALADQSTAHFCSLDTLLAQADFVVLVVPYNADTHHLINAQRIAQMKPDAVLVNIARGGVVDDAALIAAMKQGHLHSAALDVFEAEPALNPEFLSLPNVVLTPHIASSSEATRRAMAQLAIHNCLAVLAGNAAPNRVN
jgi:glyoxylate/hydroxypyruvate/2-ketogluconate reductase